MNFHSQYKNHAENPSIGCNRLGIIKIGDKKEKSWAWSEIEQKKKPIEEEKWYQTRDQLADEILQAENSIGWEYSEKENDHSSEAEKQGVQRRVTTEEDRVFETGENSEKITKVDWFDQIGKLCR